MTEIANVEMAAAWDGDDGDDWADNAARYEATNRFLRAHFERAQQLRAHDVVLDVGCGTGKSTLTAARAAHAGSALGVDLSTRMLALASDRARAEGIANVEFMRADAQVHPFDAGAFTIAISSFGTMFFNDPVAAFTNIGRAVERGGRLVITTWRQFEENAWMRTIFQALDAGRSLSPPPMGKPGPFGLAERERIEAVLGASGWGAVSIEPLDERVFLGADADDAWAFVGGLGMVRGLTGGLDPSAREAALHRLRQAVDDAATSDGVLLRCAAWLVRATRA